MGTVETHINGHGLTVETHINGHGLTVEIHINGYGLTVETHINGHGLTVETHINGHGLTVETHINGHGLSIGYITRGRSLRDLHTRGLQARGNVKPRRDALPSDVTNLYYGKSIEHLTRFEDKNNIWPKLMVSYKFMLK